MNQMAAAQARKLTQSPLAPASGVLRRKCDSCRKKKPILQRVAVSSAPENVPPIVHEVLRSPGQPLDAKTRAFMEPRFGHDFSRVRVHNDGKAAEATKAVDALAFTFKEHIAFKTGQYAPRSVSGGHLLAHELTHVLQQRYTGNRELNFNTPKDYLEREADRVADRVLGMSEQPSIPGEMRFSSTSLQATSREIIPVSSVSCAFLQREEGATPPPCPTRVDFNFTQPVHVPPCSEATLRATTDIAGITWSLEPDTVAVDPGSTIAADGTITLAASQPAGEIKARAAVPDVCYFERPFKIRSYPTGISGTSIFSIAGAGNYGAIYDHVFISADGNVASLENVGVGERFTNVPNAPAATHTITAPLFPFGGTFTLATSTLTPDATDNWFLTAAGELGGTHDSVTIGQAGINVGLFIQSASNPSPPQGLPVGFTLMQSLHWFCPQRSAANRWIEFMTVAHSRTLRNVGGILEFVTTVNGVEQVDTYVGPTGAFNLTATPASTPRSPPQPSGGGGGGVSGGGGPGAPGGEGPQVTAAPAARTVSLHVDSLPAVLPTGETLDWSPVGNALGCTIAADPNDSHNATLTIGTTAGTVTVQAANSTRTNRARVSIVITGEAP